MFRSIHLSINVNQLSFWHEWDQYGRSIWSVHLETLIMDIYIYIFRFHQSLLSFFLSFGYEVNFLRPSNEIAYISWHVTLLINTFTLPVIVRSVYSDRFLICFTQLCCFFWSRHFVRIIPEHEKVSFVEFEYFVLQVIGDILKKALNPPPFSLAASCPLNVGTKLTLPFPWNRNEKSEILTWIPMKISKHRDSSAMHKLTWAPIVSRMNSVSSLNVSIFPITSKLKLQWGHEAHWGLQFGFIPTGPELSNSWTKYFKNWVGVGMKIENGGLKQAEA